MSSDEESEDSSELSVRTPVTRESLDSKGRNSFDVAQRVRLPYLYRRGVRQLKTSLRSFINAVEISKAYCPVQITSKLEQELRMRVVAICGGSGHSLVLLDAEMGETIRVIDDSLTRSICNCMSISAPLRKQKLTPLLCTGHQDGRIVLRDLQTGTVLLQEICNIEHGGPITACHVCEGERRTLAIAGSQDKEGIFTVYMYDFSRGALACPPKQDHSVACTAIASVSVPMGHSYVCTGSIDGFVHVYEMLGDSMDRVHSFTDNGGAVFDLDVIPGIAGGERPSLLLVAGWGKAVQCYDLDAGLPFTSLASSSQHVSSAAGGITTGGTPRTRPNINSCYDGIRLIGHDGKVTAVRGILTPTLGCVTGGEDGHVCIWNLETCSLLVRFTGQHVPPSPSRPHGEGGLHEGEVSSISVSLHPRLFILTGGLDQHLSIVDLASSEDEASQRAYRILTNQEASGNRRGSRRRSKSSQKGSDQGGGRSYRLNTVVGKSISAYALAATKDSSNSTNYIEMPSSSVEGEVEAPVGRNKDFTQVSRGILIKGESRERLVLDQLTSGVASEMPMIEEDKESERTVKLPSVRVGTGESNYDLVSGKEPTRQTIAFPSESGTDSSLFSSFEVLGLANTSQGRRNSVFDSPYASNNPRGRNVKRQTKVLAQLDRVRAGLSKHDPDNEDSDDSSSVDSEDAIDFDNAMSRRPKHRGSVILNDLFVDLEAIKAAQQRRKQKRAEREAAKLKADELARRLACGETIENEEVPETEEERVRRETKAVMDAFAELTESSTDDEA